MRQNKLQTHHYQLQKLDYKKNMCSNLNKWMLQFLLTVYFVDDKINKRLEIKPKKNIFNHSFAEIEKDVIKTLKIKISKPTK